jgi:bifunctional non-homologous end joining protein LigD
MKHLQTGSRKLSKKSQGVLESGISGKMPAAVSPMLATLVNEPISGNDWVYEMKWDGYRCIAYIQGNKVLLRSRNNKSFNEKYYPLVPAFSSLKLNAVIDGEIVVTTDKGIPDFSLLQQWRSEADGQLFFYAFDLLWLDGVDLMTIPLESRRALLADVLKKGSHNVRISQTLENSGLAAFKEAERLHLEGVMAKKLGSLYLPGQRSVDWLKIKTEKQQELVIGGYTKNEGTNKLFSALLLGIMEQGEFHFVTPVGTGFNRASQLDIIKQLDPYVVKENPFATPVEYNKPSRFRPHPPKATVTWVKPKLVAEISYRELTSSGAIRQPAFRGLRPDKKPSELKMELPKSTDALLASTSFHEQRVIAAPDKKGRATLLNPSEDSQTRVVNRHEIKFSNLGKLFWPKEKIQKRDLINYYYRMAPYLLPYMKERPQILNRHPHGVAGLSFYQKDVKGKAPAWIETFPYYSYMDKWEKEFLVCTEEASLLYIASLGCIEMNPWHSKRQKPNNPDWCIIDLDPDENPFSLVIEVARVTREVLEGIDVKSYCKTSGSSGLHIYIPLGAKYDYEESKEFARRVAKVVHHELPKHTSIDRQTADRRGKLYIDFLQNRPQASVAAPYSLRPKKGATVSMPLDWDEVRKGLAIKNFTLFNAHDRVQETGDLFKPVLGKGIPLKQAVKKLEAAYPQVLDATR